MTLVVVLAYMMGSIPFALLLARRWGTPDLRVVGSGNLGAANVVRALGMKAGVVVALLDVAKGALSVALARYLSDQATAPAAAGLAAIVGHIYPVWLGFHGGKGVATACGVFAVLTPSAALPALGIFAVTAKATRYISLGSVLAALALPPLTYLAGSPAATVVAAVTASALILFRHRSNLIRWQRGLEPRLGGDRPARATGPIED